MAASEQDVSMVVEVTGLSRENASRLIQSNNGDLDAAVFKYMTEGDAALVKNDNTWDEAAFGQDRDGGPQTNVPSFQIDASMADLNEADVKIGAQSRPPSRVSNLSGMDTAVQGDGSNYNGQATGVISGGGQLRPAQQSYYDSSKWALTIVGTASIPDPPERRKEGDEPTALKPLAGDDLLPNFVAILAQLPLIRNVVFAGPARLDYAIPGSSWWDGPVAEGEDQEDDLIDVTDDESNDLDFIAEVQRLVAFAVQSIRTYGTAEHLTKLKAMQIAEEEPYASLKRIMRGFEAAFGRFQTDLALARLFRAAVVKEEDEQTLPFYMLEINLDDLDEAPEDLYDALDMVFWAAGDADFEVASLCVVPQVLTVGLRRRSQRTDGLGIRVPAELYLGRYLSANQASARQVRDAIARSRAEVEGFERERRALLEFRRRDGTVVPDMVKVFEHVLSAAPNRSDVAKELPHIEGLQDQQMFDEVEKKFLELTAKVDAVEAKKRAVMATADDHLNWLKTAGSTSMPTTNKRYRLQGVIIDWCTTYLPVDRRREVDEDAMDEDDEPQPQTATTEQQWWKIYFGVGNAMSCNEVEVADALRAAENDSKNVVLVYASDDAVEVSELVPIPEPLKAFVAKDNEEFEKEVEQFVDEQRAAARKAQSLPDWGPKEPEWEDDPGATWSNYIGPG